MARRTYGTPSAPVGSSKPGSSDKKPSERQFETVSPSDGEEDEIVRKSPKKGTESGQNVSSEEPSRTVRLSAKEKPKKVRTKEQKVRIFLFVTLGIICLGVGGFFAWRAYSQYQDDEEVEAMWEDIRTKSVKGEIPTENGKVLDAESTYSKDPFDRDIDWDALLAINSDVKCWVYIPGTNIDFPVLQEQKHHEFYYLSHDIYKKYNTLGCILAAKEPEGYEDLEAHAIFYGHKAYGKQMFGNLMKFKDSDFISESPYVYVYYPNRTERWTVWSAFHTTKDDDIYSMPYEAGTEIYQTLIDHIDSSKLYTTQSGKPDFMERTLTLSTCDNPRGGSDGRFTVNCRLRDVSKDIKWFNEEDEAAYLKEKNQMEKDQRDKEEEKRQKDNENGNFYQEVEIEGTF